jgi:hypothetical protein
MKRVDLDKLTKHCPYQYGEDGAFRRCLGVLCPFYAEEGDAYTFCKKANVELIGRPK